MATQVHPSRVPGRAPRLRLGTAVAALTAALLSAGLAYWASSERTAEPLVARLAPTRSYAPPQPDPAAVRRAYDQVREVYVARGVDGVMEIADGCARAVSAHPDKLDFCVSFAILGRGLAATSDSPLANAWAQSVPGKELVVISSALPPGADAAERWMRLEALLRAISRPADAIAPVPPPASPTPYASPARPAAVGAATPPSRAVHARAATRRVAGRKLCAPHSAASGSTSCVRPRLRIEEGRMREAYAGALARGADPERLKADQDAWRARVQAAPRGAAVAQLYRTRTLELEGMARKAWPYD